ncbi:MAG: c-type cytochrome domain-containing protein, partial [Planctomycetaceae bacterium]
MSRLLMLSLCLFAGLSVSGVCNAQSTAIRFDRDIRPLLSDRCFACHGPDQEHREADLRLDQQEAAFAERESGAAIVSGKADESQIWQRITSTDPDLQMPPPETGKPLVWDV